MKTDILFLTLNVFSATGGIEKVCRIAGKGFYENSLRNQYRFRMLSLHDTSEAAAGNPYFPEMYFQGYAGSRQKFVPAAVRHGCQSRVVVLSHINLLITAWMIKKFCPATKIILLAHGIEVWETLSPRKKKRLQSVDTIMSVSRYTKERIEELHGFPGTKIKVLNNCLDPYLPLPRNLAPDEAFYARYNCRPGDRIIFTLTRLASTEHYKGYDIVLRALKELDDPSIKYLLAGKYDAVEFSFLQQLILTLGLQEQVILPGFIPEEDIGKLFTIATLYAMPSSKEGFGIVFIEAMFYGLPVIAGNADGSADALLNGELGTLVSPHSVEEVALALKNILADPQKFKPDAKLLEGKFGYDAYKKRLNEMVSESLIRC